MPLNLLLRLPTTGQAETEWLTTDETGVPTAAVQRGPLELAAAAARTANVIALAPATLVLLAEPELPPGSGVKLARAVPFALEEQLTEDIDLLIFAIGRRNLRGATPVAVVSREVMQGWIAALNAAGITPAAMYADIALLPANPGQTVLWLEQERLAVRRPGAVPFTVEVAPIADALLFAGVIADPQPMDGEEPKALESATLYVTRGDWERVQSEIDGLTERFESLRVQLLQQGPLPWLARALPATDAVNLLQGEFARTAEFGVRWREWRTAAFLSLALLGAHVAAQSIEIRQANRQTAALDREIAEVFASAMPSETMQDARRQMQSRLQLVRGAGAGPEVFLHMMQSLGRVLAGAARIDIDSLSFREQTLDLKVTAPNVEALSRISQEAAKNGLTAEIQSSTPVAAGVEAHLQLRAAGAGARP